MILLQQQIRQNALAQDDESDTNTEQRLRQKNLGSGESSNFNCGSNAFKGVPSSLSFCETEETTTGAFTISGQGSGFNSFICNGISEDGLAAITISAQGQEDGTVTGSVFIQIPGGNAAYPVSGGTTDGNTFSLSGETSGVPLCIAPVQQFTVSGECGTGVTIRYEEPDAIGTFTGNVECTLA